MKGIVFTEFLDMVADQFSPELADSLVEQSELPSGGAYTALGTYDYEELAQLAVCLSKETDIALPELLRVFGRHLFPRFHALYPQFFTKDVHCFQFLQSVEHYIHIEVRKLYPDAQLPSFEYDASVEGRLIMDYRSARPLGDFALGLLTGCLDHFGEPIDVETENLSEGDKHRVRFILTKGQARPVDTETAKAEPAERRPRGPDVPADGPLSAEAADRVRRHLERERRARQMSEMIAEEKTRDLYHANSELQNTLGYLRTIIDTMVDGLLVIDPQGFIKLVSRSSLGLLGFEHVDELLDKRAADVLDPALVTHIDHSLAHPEGSHANVGFQGGGKRPLDAVASPIKADTAGQRLGLVVLVRDISAEVAIKKQRSMTEMVVGVSHELNTPLSVVDMAARIIQDSLADETIKEMQGKDEDVEELIDDVLGACKLITQNTKRVHGLIQSFKKLSVNMLGSDIETVDICDFIYNVVVPLQMSSKRLVVELLDTLEEADKQWIGFPGHLAQVLTYLMDNVVEHAYPGATMCQAKITTTLSPDGNDYMLVVSDSGVGIAKEHQSQVFDAFFTTNRGSSNGLGLAITHNIIVDALKGAIAVDSAPGEGTTFRINFPRKLA